MQAYSFSKLIPGGNPTIILEDPPSLEPPLPELAARVMSPLHVHAEQVGALYSAQADEWSDARPVWKCPRLTMMGGEFCVNAARAAALILALQGCLRRLPGAPGAHAGRLMVSGAGGPVDLLAAPDAASLELALDQAMRAPAFEALAGAEPDAWSDAEQALMHCAARVPLDAVQAGQIQQGLWLARLPGMVHLLADAARIQPPDFSGSGWRKESQALRLMGGLDDEAASGVVWFEKLPDGACRIHPAVAVRDTASEYLESACGSASLALALLLAKEPERAGNASKGLRVIQPSGQSLLVLLEDAGAAAWVAGPVHLAARGTLFV